MCIRDSLSTGGTSVDITDMMHPENIFLCERISRVIGLDTVSYTHLDVYKRQIKFRIKSLK